MMSSKTEEYSTGENALSMNEGPSMDARMRVLEQRKKAAKKKARKRSTAGVMAGGSMSMGMTGSSMLSGGRMSGGSMSTFSPMSTGFSSPMGAASKSAPSGRTSRFSEESRGTAVRAASSKRGEEEEERRSRRSASSKRDEEEEAEEEEEEYLESTALPAGAAAPSRSSLHVRTAKSPPRRSSQRDREEDEERRTRPSPRRHYESDEEAEVAQEKAHSPIVAAPLGGRRDDSRMADSPRVVTRADAAAAAAASPRSVDPDLSDMMRFLTTPLPKECGVVQCYIERRRKGPITRQFPEYYLHLKDGREFLLVAKKKPGNKTSNYHISMDKKLTKGTRGSDAFVGKLRSNFMGTEFYLYDNGTNPKEMTQGMTGGARIDRVRR